MPSAHCHAVNQVSGVVDDFGSGCFGVFVKLLKRRYLLAFVADVGITDHRYSFRRQYAASMIR